MGNCQSGESLGLKGSSRPSRRIIYDATVITPVETLFLAVDY
jgi:hypothetical protein